MLKTHSRITRLISVIIIFLFLFCPPLYADGTHPQGIKLDGTIGTAGKIELPGPNYAIKPEYGKQSGANLFHSFQQFNIHKNESATFSGPASVKNIISRVTGGSASWIDGKLASTISGADMYFLNPFGIMFGSNASLDLSGSFHVSTADYLRMGENERFYAMPHQNEVLSVAPPSAFGFLSDKPAKISVDGRGAISADQWDGKPAGLSVPQGKTISVIAGDIEIRNGTWFETVEMGELFFINPHAEKLPGSLTAPGGQINMASVASSGEVAIGNGKPDIGDMKGGNITISGKSLIDVSGQGAGNVFIRCGNFVADDSAVYAKTLGDKNGGVIDIQADTVSFQNGSEINGDTYGKGKGGDIKLKASGSLTFSGADNLKNASRIFLNTHSKAENAGYTGSLDISAKDIIFSDGAFIECKAFGTGNGGKLTLSADSNISFSGINYDPYLNYCLRVYFGNNPVNPQAGLGGIIISSTGGGKSGDIEMKLDNLFLSDSASIDSTTFGPGNSGNISIYATGAVNIADSIGPAAWTGQISTNTVPMGFGAVSGDAGRILLECGSLTIRDGGLIGSFTYNLLGGKSGKAGEINIRASGDVLLSGANPYGTTFPYGSLIAVASGGDSGNSGNIFLKAHSLILENGAAVSAATLGNAPGGNVHIQADDSIRITGSSPVKLLNPKYYSQDEIQHSFSRIEANSQITDKNSGNSGTVAVQARNISISDGGMITTSSVGGGQAGDIKLNVGNLEIHNGASVSSNAVLSGGGRITVNAKDTVYLSDSSITTNVSSGIEKGGDITIGNPDTGTGSRFFIMNHSRIQANARGKGDGGAVFIQTENFLKSADSKVTATSERGNQGTVEIEAPDLDLSGVLMFLPGSILDAAQFAPTPCYARSGRTFSTFVITGPDAVPTPADDLHSAPLSGTGTVFTSEDTTSVSEYLNLSDYFGKKKFSPRNEPCETCDKK